MNRAKQFRNINELDMEMSVNPTPLQQEIEHDRDTPTDLAIAMRIDEILSLELSTVDIGQLATQVGLRAVVMPSSWSFQLTNGISIYDELTWHLPAIPGSSTVSRQTSPSTKQTPSGESYLELVRNLIKNSGIYAVSSLAGPLVGLLMSPFLTHTLSRTDYGALVVLNTVVGLVTGVSELGLGASFSRTYSLICKTQREQLDALSTLVLLMLLILLPVAVVGVIAAPWLSVVLLGSTSYSGAVAVGSVLVLSQNLTVPGLIWLRVESRAAFFSTISIANLLSTAGANILLVGILHQGVMGSLIASGLGDIVIIAFTLTIIFWRAGFHLHFSMARILLAFGIPQVINPISGWFLQLSDRYLLEHFTSLSLAGGYSVAYALGGISSAGIIAPFSLAWYVLMFHIAKREDAKHVFKLIFRGYSFVLLFATLGLSLFGSSALDLLFPVSYHGQWPIIPIIALSTMFSGISIMVEFGMSLYHKIWLVSIINIICALINIGVNILLIPVYGTMGAALATLVAYIAMAMLAYLFNQRIYPVSFEIELFFIALGIGIAFYLIDSVLDQGQNMVVSWSVHIGVLLLYGLLLLFLRRLLPNLRRTDSFSYTKKETY